MPLSTMQEVLILLEDEKEVQFFRLNRWGRPVRGVLAKLKNLGWVEKIKSNEDISYRISEKGERYFDDTLSILKDTKPWNKKWCLVIFDIPESNRSTRDKLRRALVNIGMGLLQASVWISSNDVREKLEKISERLRLQNNLRYFEVSSSPVLNKQIIEKAWNLPEVNLQFERFIKNSERALKNMGKGNGDRYNAKKLIFEYALILKKDPKLPSEFVEQNNLRAKAREIYSKLRHFAV